jgi:hypothetical protein
MIPRKRGAAAYNEDNAANVSAMMTMGHAAPCFIFAAINAKIDAYWSV